MPQSGSSYRLAPHFLAAADANLSFAYVCQFLYLNAFKFRQMRDSVPSDQRLGHARPDLAFWRENLASARAAKKQNAAGEATSSGKTNYALMSVVVVYWGYALLEPLATAFHNTRTVRWVHSHVGWDMVIEMLNLLVKQSVVANITHDLIRKFIRRLNFTWVVHRALDAIVKEHRQRDEATLKNIDTTVQELLDWLRTIGTDYATATAPSDDNLLGLDLSQWGGVSTAYRRTDKNLCTAVLHETLETSLTATRGKACRPPEGRIFCLRSRGWSPCIRHRSCKPAFVERRSRRSSRSHNVSGSIFAAPTAVSSWKAKIGAHPSSL